MYTGEVIIWTMIDFKNLKENFTTWEQGLKRRGSKIDLDHVLAAYDKYLKELQGVEELRSQKNAAAKSKDIEVGKKVGAALGKSEKKLAEMEKELHQLAGAIPNIPQDDVPKGGEDSAIEIAQVGKPQKISKVKDHIELGNSLDIIDIERGAKVAGSRFYYLKNEAVELEFALVRWIMDLLKEKDFGFLVGPQLVSEKVMMAGGYLGKAADEVYKTQDDLYLIGTSEQSILGYHMDEIIEVPKRYASFSTCFRREAGSHGKDVKGIIRSHQFDKIEMFAYTAPEDSASEHEFLVSIEEEILQRLEIPYRKMLLGAGDMSAASSKTYDLESWIPSQDSYRETQSCSNCTDWQARMANIRFKREGKTEYVHTLNGTAIAIGRLLVALLENHQQADGSVKMPAALHPYLSFKEISPK